MVQKLSELTGKKISVLLGGSPKGIIKIKGTLIDTNDEDGLITVSTEGGMMGSKKREIIYNIYSILGIEIEE